MYVFGYRLLKETPWMIHLLLPRQLWNGKHPNHVRLSHKGLYKHLHYGCCVYLFICVTFKLLVQMLIIELFYFQPWSGCIMKSPLWDLKSVGDKCA